MAQAWHRIASRKSRSQWQYRNGWEDRAHSL